MRKLLMKMSVSVDGFVAGANGENDWIFKSSDPESTAWAVDVSRQAGLIIMGRKSFEIMAPYWPTATGPFAAPMNTISKGVFSKQKSYGVSLPTASSEAEVSWAKARVFAGDLSDEIKRLKQEPGKPISAIGGAGFMRSLVETGLIDEYHLAVHPVVLGSGLPIFTNLAKPLHLKLISSKDFPGGIVVHSYRAD